MLSGLPLFQVYGAMARHAAESHKVSAENISRAGEPGYKAQEVETFESYLSRARSSDSAGLPAGTVRSHQADSPMSPNGNSVNIEREIFKSAEAIGQHNMALSVYTKSLQLMRTAIGRR